MEPGVFPEGVGQHDHSQGTAVKTQHRAEEHLEALVGAVAKLRQQLPVVLEIDAQHDRDAEDELSAGHGMENAVEDVFRERWRAFHPGSAPAKPMRRGRISQSTSSA